MRDDIAKTLLPATITKQADKDPMAAVPELLGVSLDAISPLWSKYIAGPVARHTYDPAGRAVQRASFKVAPYIDAVVTGAEELKEKATDAAKDYGTKALDWLGLNIPTDEKVDLDGIAKFTALRYLKTHGGWLPSEADFNKEFVEKIWPDVSANENRMPPSVMAALRNRVWKFMQQEAKGDRPAEDTLAARIGAGAHNVAGVLHRNWEHYMDKPWKKWMLAAILAGAGFTALRSLKNYYQDNKKKRHTNYIEIPVAKTAAPLDFQEELNREFEPPKSFLEKAKEDALSFFGGGKGGEDLSSVAWMTLGVPSALIGTIWLGNRLSKKWREAALRRKLRKRMREFQEALVAEQMLAKQSSVSDDAIDQLFEELYQETEGFTKEASVADWLRERYYRAAIASGLASALLTYYLATSMSANRKEFKKLKKFYNYQQRKLEAPIVTPIELPPAVTPEKKDESENV